MYSQGIGVPKNTEEAFKWNKKAAELGYTPAQFALGGAYHLGIGTKADIPFAKYWLQKAAQSDDKDIVRKALSMLYVLNESK